jgi:DNA-binding IclR family transcriptional regulator
MTTPTKPKTARERALDALRESEHGLSKSELRKAVGGNAGAFRRLVQSMIDKDEITVTEENRPTCGLTKVHRAAI